MRITLYSRCIQILFGTYLYLHFLTSRLLESSPRGWQNNCSTRRAINLSFFNGIFVKWPGKWNVLILIKNFNGRVHFHFVFCGFVVASVDFLSSTIQVVCVLTCQNMARAVERWTCGLLRLNWKAYCYNKFTVLSVESTMLFDGIWMSDRRCVCDYRTLEKEANQKKNEWLRSKNSFSHILMTVGKVYHSRRYILGEDTLTRIFFHKMINRSFKTKMVGRFEKNLYLYTHVFS